MYKFKLRVRIFFIDAQYRVLDLQSVGEICETDAHHWKLSKSKDSYEFLLNQNLKVIITKRTQLMTMWVSREKL